MDGAGFGAPPNAGEVLLQLLRNPPTSKSATSFQYQEQNGVSEDPAVAALGPEIRSIPLERSAFGCNGGGLQYTQLNHGSTSTAPFVPDRYFRKSPDLNPSSNPRISFLPDRVVQSSNQFSDQSNRGQICGVSRNFDRVGDGSRPGGSREVQQSIVFGSFNQNMVQRDDAGSVRMPNFRGNNIGDTSKDSSSGILGRRHGGNPMKSNDVNGYLTTVNHRQSYNGQRTVVQPPPGYSSNARNLDNRENGNWRRNSGQYVDGHKNYLQKSDRQMNHRREVHGSSAERRVEYVGTVTVVDESNQRRVSSGSPDEDRVEYVGTIIVEDATESVENGEELRNAKQGKGKRDSGFDDVLEDEFARVLEVEDESGDTVENKKHHRDKDYRSDKRGQWIMNQRMRHMKSQMRCRSDIYRFDAPFLEIYQALIPAEEEKIKQMQLLKVLEVLVAKEWPDARLHLYGSCANSFGFPKSDIDVCLVMDLENTDKAEVLHKLAEILESGDLKDVQAFTRARVPIVKLKDPVTGISCDICINNVLAVVNTKLLRDYAGIDHRLRQLAFIVKHWAKSRLVNETYHGTLSSYAYVLMCIHLLQQRNPPILPCLQEMESTYSISVENVECAYFDQVDKLGNFGSRNRETIARLVWAFFHYWAYCHDYASDVISIRKGTTLSKHDKDWTRRIGNDRHLICIEDPFEVSHDLGRVVDKHSVRVLREEFERAARIMQNDPNPSSTLFEPYIPD